jgi:hypothetical protein
VPGPTFETIVIRDQVVYAGGIFFVGLGGRPFTTYPGGDFTGALDIHTGKALDWDPRPNGDVSILCESGGRIYMGGLFTSVRDWVPRFSLGALDLGTGALTSWTPSLDGIPWAMISYQRKLYLGGQIFSINGQPRANLAALDPVTGQLLDWNPACGGVVKSLAAADGRIWIGGYFKSMGGLPRLNLAAVDTVQGNPTGWDPSADDIVSRVVVREGTVYTAGWFAHVGGQSRHQVAALDTISGLATSWNTPGASSGTIRDLAVGDSAVYVAGSFDAIGTVHRDLIAALDRRTGDVLPWDAHIAPSTRLEGYSGVYEGPAGVDLLAASASALYASGSFDRVGGSPRERLVALDPTSGAVLDWDPGAPVQAFDVTERDVILGGAFSFAGPIPTNAIVRVDPPPALHAPRPSPGQEVAFSLGRPAPNPAQGEAVIGYELRSAAPVSLELFDPNGRRQQGLVHDQYETAGAHAIAFSTASLSPGLYYVKLTVGGRSRSHTLVVLR